jgi:hypothetical protein
MIENLFLSAGAMKAGTTWVYDKLQYNPNITFSKEKEIYYLSHVDGVANSLTTDKRIRRAKQALRKSSKLLKEGKLTLPDHMDNVDWYLNYSSNELDDEWYQNLFADKLKSDTGKYCADFSNLTCFLSDEGWEHVRRIAKNIKVIYILRNPIDRFWSHYKFHLQFVEHAEMNTPEHNIKLFDRVTEKQWFIRNSLYSENVKRMKKNLHDDEFKIYFLDDISAEPDKYLKDIEDFIGVGNFDYSGLALKSRKNTSIDKTIPMQWLKKIEQRLGNEMAMLKEMQLWHSAWTTNNGK